jgi:hypothetical protein
MALGSFAQSYYDDRTNVVADQIDNAIKRDLMFQKMRLEKGQDDFRNKNLLLRQFMDTSEHVQDAEDKAYLTAMSGIRAQLEAKKALLTSPEMRANLEQTAAQLELKEQEVQQRLTERLIGHDVKMSNAESKLALEQEKLDMRRQELRVREQEAAARATRASSQDAMKANKLTAPNVQGEFRDAKPAADYRIAEAVASSLIDNITRLQDVLSRDAGSLSEVIENRREWNQLMADLELVAKGKDGGYNLGAALTGTELDRLRNALGTGNFSYFFSGEGKAALERTKNRIAETVAKRMKAEGVRPAKSHPFLEAEDGEQ